MKCDLRSLATRADFSMNQALVFIYIDVLIHIHASVEIIRKSNDIVAENILKQFRNAWLQILCIIYLIKFFLFSPISETSGIFCTLTCIPRYLHAYRVIKLSFEGPGGRIDRHIIRGFHRKYTMRISYTSSSLHVEIEAHIHACLFLG